MHKKLQQGTVYVTLGSDGCLWLEMMQIRHSPAFKINVVDTTGAGDVFHGAFALAIAEGQQADEAIRFSSAVAGLKCTRLGGRDGIPDRQQVMTSYSNSKSLTTATVRGVLPDWFFYFEMVRIMHRPTTIPCRQYP